jgi:formate dehydrogenase subunit gamma
MVQQEELSMEARYRRFSTGRIFEHWFHVFIFGVLVATGLSQKYHALDFSQWLILHLCGIDSVRIIHRTAGTVLALAVTAHVMIAVIGLVYHRWQPSLVISRDDFNTASHNIRYYLGAERSPAMSGKFSYTQKFEYWGILTGVVIMIVTGAILWKPLLVTKFITGEIIPAAKVLHSNEALVVFTIISLWHIYNAIFSPEVFPLNASIFTGYLSRERMVNEHLLELARIERTTPEAILALWNEDSRQDNPPSAESEIRLP